MIFQKHQYFTFARCVKTQDLIILEISVTEKDILTVEYLDVILVV